MFVYKRTGSYYMYVFSICFYPPNIIEKVLYGYVQICLIYFNVYLIFHLMDVP